jgi:hypothetical protein
MHGRFGVELSIMVMQVSGLLCTIVLHSLLEELTRCTSALRAAMGTVCQFLF